MEKITLTAIILNGIAIFVIGLAGILNNDANYAVSVILGLLFMIALATIYGVVADELENRLQKRSQNQSRKIQQFNKVA